MAKAASCKDFGVLVVDISVALMHARTDEEIYVKVPPGIKSSRFWRLKAAVNGPRKASKRWQEFSCDKLVTKMQTNRTTSIRVFTSGFATSWTWNSTVTIFLVCGLTSNLECLADEFKNHFLVKKAEIVSLRPKRQKETHFLKLPISVDDFGWHVELDRRNVNSLLDAMAMNHCKSTATPGSKGQESSHVETEKAGPKGTSRVPIWCWNLVVHDRPTLRHCLQRNGTEENKQFVKYTLDLLSIPNYYIKNGRPHGHRYGKKPGDHEYFIANSLKKKCKKRHFLGIHDRFIRDEKFRKNMIDVGRTEEMCRDMDNLANEDHTHRITEEEIRVYRNNWWIRSNIVSSDTMPVRHRADFKQALTTLRQLKNQEDTAYYQNWQSSSSSWWNWQESW